jgi:Zn-dependent peptidase ImmA (M78 family)
VSEQFNFKRGFKTQAEKEAIKIRESLNIQKFEPLLASQLASHLSIKLITPNEVPGIDLKHLKQLANSDEWSALTMLTIKGQRLIIHNDQHSKARQESNIMHEIAHVLCNYTTPDISSIDGVGILTRFYNEEQEKEADWLGACLKLPRDAIIWALRRKMNEEKISHYYSVSIDLVRFRINTTGAQKQISYQWKNR